MDNIDRKIFAEEHHGLDMTLDDQGDFLNQVTLEFFESWLENKMRKDRHLESLWRIESANKQAAIHGPMLNIGVCWLANGIGGSTFEEELIGVGYHIVQPERMPDWLIQKLDARKGISNHV